MEDNFTHPRLLRFVVKQIMCVRLLQWPIDHVMRRRKGNGHEIRAGKEGGELPDETPLVLVRTVASRHVVTVVNAQASALGIRPGFTLTQARALCANVRYLDHDPSSDVRSLEALARWMQRFTPTVDYFPRTFDDVEDQADDPLGHAVFLDVTGCQRLYGSLVEVCRRVKQAMQGFGVRARCVVASTPSGAYALASSGRFDLQVIEPHDVRESLRVLHVRSLRLDESVVATLRHLGIETIGQLMDLPRRALPARFGDELLQRLDRASGDLPDPMCPLDHTPDIRARVDFDYRIESPEAIWRILEHLLDRVIEQLIRTGCGVRELRLKLARPHDEPVLRTIRTSRLTRLPQRLLSLIRCVLEQDIDRPRRRSGRVIAHSLSDQGFSTFEIAVIGFERISQEQLTLDDSEHRALDQELSRLLEMLTLRMGESGVRRARCVDSHLPELATVWSDAFWRCSDVEPTSRARPMRLQAGPTRIRVTSLRNEVDDIVPPLVFEWNGTSSRIVHMRGPERIAGPWWEGREKTRDYFEVEDESHRRLWIFRVVETGEWFFHGEYA
jgi:protein ImuB